MSHIALLIPYTGTNREVRATGLRGTYYKKKYPTMWNKKFPIINFSLEPLWLQTTDPVSPNPPPIQLIYWFLTPVQIKKPAFYKSYLANFVSKKLGNSIGSHITGVLLTLRISDGGGVSSKIDSKLCARSSNQESSYYFSHKRRTKTNLSEPLALGCCCLPYYLHTMLSLNGL